jgi:hypothetical protein
MPDLAFDLGPLGTITLGDAANGLCGGMSFTVADLFAIGKSPGNARQPTSGEPRFDYIVQRQLASLDGIGVPLRFYSLMRTNRPPTEPSWLGWLGPFGSDHHSRGYVMVAEEWPRIRADLDAGRPSMIGLVRIVSDDPRQLNHNHQVLAFGYDLDGTAVKIWIYDPNWPGQAVILAFDVGDPKGIVTTTYSMPDPPVVCFFRAPYQPRVPDPWR